MKKNGNVKQEMAPRISACSKQLHWWRSDEAAFTIFSSMVAPSEVHPTCCNALLSQMEISKKPSFVLTFPDIPS